MVRYEPVLLALLKRREAAAGALVKAKEQAQEQRAQLRPLKDEIQKLKLQRACLEDKLNLIHMQRKEDVGQYKVRKMAEQNGKNRNRLGQQSCGTFTGDSVRSGGQQQGAEERAEDSEEKNQGDGGAERQPDSTASTVQVQSVVLLSTFGNRSDLNKLFLTGRPLRTIKSTRRKLDRSILKFCNLTKGIYLFV